MCVSNSSVIPVRESSHCVIWRRWLFQSRRIRGFIYNDPFIRYKTIGHTCMGGDNRAYRLTPRTQGNSTDPRSLLSGVLFRVARP